MGILNIFGNSDKKHIEEESYIEDNRGNMIDNEIHLIAKDTLTEILDLMGFFNVVKVVRYDEDFVALDIKGDDMGRIIGKDGTTLQAIQLLLKTILCKKFKKSINLVIDANGYRAKREDSLRNLAKEMGEKAISSKKEVALEPMLAWERRIVHLTLQDYEELKTESVGEYKERRVVIIPL
jgi:spoIIIJ-associated protein